ncbi:helix-turn-helix domain-containing protein [Fulvivirga ligni]|uniref:helix-turn-helix domain-containing protein n=1 Tax=Fulvivirga ligni TaxID=2904246 RepID=UPI001F1D8849|nr:AraC family transcriptional regulator [Fulvivirga ligni]UII19877.1 AraC family transcriptional regulator [Fulvivirga ligni]
MNHYQTELNKIRKSCFSNDRQLETVIAVRNYIDNHFDQELNLELLSHIRFTSKYHLLRLFKKYYGITPKQYLLIKRLEATKHYLRQGMPVTEVCYAAGFDTPSSFSTLFRAKIGVSPAEYQKEQLSQSISSL